MKQARTRRKPPAPEAERVQKYLARLGLGSRREIEAWIRAGRLTINSEPATLGARVTPRDEIRLDGRIVRQRAPVRGGAVFVGHRSPGEALLPSGANGAAWTDRLPRRAGRRFIAISPMPRMDGGLELVTSDGELAAKLQRAAHRLSSEFSVRVRGELSDEQIGAILQGTLDRGTPLTVEHCEPAGGEGTNRWYTISVHGGSGKDVRQLFERNGAFVSRILRVRMGPLVLDRTLARGHFRELTREEILQLTTSITERQTSRP